MDTSEAQMHVSNTRLAHSTVYCVVTLPNMQDMNDRTLTSNQQSFKITDGRQATEQPANATDTN